MLSQFVGKTGFYRPPYEHETRATVGNIVRRHNAAGQVRAYFEMSNGEMVPVEHVYFDCGDNVRIASATS